MLLNELVLAKKLDRTQKPYLYLAENPKNGLQKASWSLEAKNFVLQVRKNLCWEKSFLFSYLCSEIKNKLRISGKTPPPSYLNFIDYIWLYVDLMRRFIWSFCNLAAITAIQLIYKDSLYQKHLPYLTWTFILHVLQLKSL